MQVRAAALARSVMRYRTADFADRSGKQADAPQEFLEARLALQTIEPGIDP